MDLRTARRTLDNLYKQLGVNRKYLEEAGLSDTLITALQSHTHEAMATVRKCIAPPALDNKPTMTDQQYLALWDMYNEDDSEMDFASFIMTTVNGDYDSIRVLWGGMFIGIEKDGHRHS